MQRLHKVQMQILRKLLFNPKVRFTDLNIASMTSDHFTYHVNTLIREGYIEKIGKRYVLTIRGKEFANTMDTSALKIEKQAKVSVLIIGRKEYEGKVCVLVQTRLKEPFFGFKGFVTGKVGFGETVLDAARREFLEETGLHADFKFRFILHEHIYSEDERFLEDKFFYVYNAANTKGRLSSIPGGRNEWILESEFTEDKKKFYDQKDLLSWSKRPPTRRFIEKSYYVREF